MDITLTRLLYAKQHTMIATEAVAVCHNRDIHQRKVTFDKSSNEGAEDPRLSSHGMADDDLEICEQPSSEGLTIGAQTQSKRMQLALGVVVRLFLPLINGMAKRWQGLKVLRLPRSYHANRSLFTNLFAHAANTLSLSLSSVQVTRFDPWLRRIKFRRPTHDRLITSATQTSRIVAEEVPEKSVTLNVLYEPPKGVPIRADVVFIHGLHGSLVNTWKQGTWNSEGRQERFNRPPRPPVRPPKRPRHSRKLEGPHILKRPRHFHMGIHTGAFPEWTFNSKGDDVSDSEDQPIPRDLTYYSDEPETTETIDELEYIFPTFRTMMEEESGGVYSLTVEERSPGKLSKRKTSAKQGDYSPCWPRDWLSKRFPDLRIIALNYTTDPYLWRPLWIKKRNRTSLTERSREMTDMLIKNNVGVGNPIIWVGHSKGGIFIKQILVDAWESGRVAAEPLWKSSRGTFFYSVPHRGSPLADFNLPLLRQSVELLEIKKNCPSILDLHRRFVALYHKGHLKIRVFSFVETALTLMSVLYLRIVGVDSADPGIGHVCGVHLDHREICKPKSETCMLYLELVRMIENVTM